MMSKSEKYIRKLLESADIQIGGTRPWDPKIHNQHIYNRVLKEGTLAIGESYMDEWWSTDNLDELLFKTFRSKIDISFNENIFFLLSVIKSRLFNKQNKSRATQVGERHYDIGNDLYERMLDPYMQYSCGYWKEASTLNEAQLAKMDLICRKLGLEKDMKVLDVGCGWGGLSQFMAEKYGVEVLGITISKEQEKLARKRTQGLSVEIRNLDYRSLTDEKFDRIVSVGMFEHVGYKNYRSYMKKMHELLSDDGLFLLHTIGNSRIRYTADPWIDKYIFPNGMIVSSSQLNKSFEKLFLMEDWHNFGAYYDKTLCAWNNNFQHAWEELKASGKYEDRFARMWEFYLLSSAANFRARSVQLWQIVLSKNGTLGGHKSVR